MGPRAHTRKVLHAPLKAKHPRHALYLIHASGPPNGDRIPYTRTCLITPRPHTQHATRTTHATQLKSFPARLPPPASMVAAANAGGPGDGQTRRRRAGLAALAVVLVAGLAAIIVVFAGGKVRRGRDYECWCMQAMASRDTSAARLLSSHTDAPHPNAGPKQGSSEVRGDDDTDEHPGRHDHFFNCLAGD